MIEDLREPFGLPHVVSVGDRGMVTTDNGELLPNEHGYVIRLQRRRREEVYRHIQRSGSGRWINCPVGITVSEKSMLPRTLGQEVDSEQEGVRIFVAGLAFVLCQGLDKKV